MTFHARQRAIERFGTNDAFYRVAYCHERRKLVKIADGVMAGEWLGWCQNRAEQHLYAWVAPDGSIKTILTDGMETLTSGGRKRLARGKLENVER